MCLTGSCQIVVGSPWILLRACLKSGVSARFYKRGEHDFAGSDVNGGLGMLGFAFIILSRPAVTTGPGESALDQPAFGQDFETGIDAFKDFDLRAALRDEPLTQSRSWPAYPPSAKTLRTQPKFSKAGSSNLAPSGSCKAALLTTTARISPKMSTKRCRFLTTIFLTAS